MLIQIQSEVKASMKKTIHSLENTFSSIRAGRANPSLLEQVKVDYYNSMVPISQVSKISVENATTLKLTTWDRDMVSAIEKAIIKSDLGLNPQVAGQVMLIPIPPLTKERRLDLVKLVKAEAEQTKIAIRNIRRNSNSDLKKLTKEQEISKDDVRKAEEATQKITNEYIAIVDEKLNHKKSQLLDI